MNRTSSEASEKLPLVTEESYNPNLDEIVPAPEEPQGDMFMSGGDGSINTQLAFVESGTIDHGASVSKKHVIKGKSFRNLRSASMSISMLAKPSDDRKANAFLAGWNVSNLIQGTGILGVPYAVRQGGWAAVAMIFFVAFLCCHTGKLLIDCMYEKSKKTGIRRRLRVNYPEVAEACHGHKGHVLVGIVQCIEMFGGVIMYVVLLGTVWHDMLKSYIPSLGIKEWAAINCCVALPSLFIRKMSVVSWFSMVSVFSLMSSLFVLIAICFTQVPNWKLNNIPDFDPQTFPVGFGIIVFSYTAHAVFPSIEGSMKKPEQFNNMLNSSFLLAAGIKAALGTFMVLTYGKSTKEVATVTLSDHKVFSYAATSLVISNVLLALPLVMFIVSLTFDDAFLKYFPYLQRDSKYHWIWLVMTRPLLLSLALFIAIEVPHFGLIMGVIGSFTGTCLCFILPCWFHMKLRWDSLKIWEITFEIIIIVFGIIAGGLGFVFSGKSLVLALMKEN